MQSQPSPITESVGREYFLAYHRLGNQKLQETLIRTSLRPEGGFLSEYYHTEVGGNTWPAYGFRTHPSTWTGYVRITRLELAQAILRLF